MKPGLPEVEVNICYYPGLRWKKKLTLPTSFPSPSTDKALATYT